MLCTEIKEHLLDYLDNELPATLHQEVEQHLRACLDCRGELESFRTTALLLQLRAVPEPPSEYWEQTWDRIRARTLARVLPLRAEADQPAPVWQRLVQVTWRPLLVAAATLLIVALGLTAWQQFNRDPQPPALWSKQHLTPSRQFKIQPVNHAVYDEDMPAELRRQIELMSISRGTMGSVDPISKSAMMVTLEGTRR